MLLEDVLAYVILEHVSSWGIVRTGRRQRPAGDRVNPPVARVGRPAANTISVTGEQPV
jgi:hypothetical protein